MTSPYQTFLDKVQFDTGVLTAMGRVQNAWSTIKFAAGTSGLTEYDLWTEGGNLSYLSSPEYLLVSSSSASDVDQGAGAWVIRFVGLDGNFLYKQEDIVLNGVAPVQTVNQYLRVFRAYVLSSGTSAGAVGKITFAATPSDTVQASIKIGTNQTLMSHITTPADRFGLVMGGTLGCAKGQAVHFHVKTRSLSTPNSPFTIKRAFDVYQSTLPVRNEYPRIIPPSTDYKWTIRSDAAGVGVTGDYTIVLYDLAYWNRLHDDLLLG